MLEAAALVAVWSAEASLRATKNIAPTRDFAADPLSSTEAAAEAKFAMVEGTAAGLVTAMVFGSPDIAGEAWKLLLKPLMEGVCLQAQAAMERCGHAGRGDVA